MVLHPLIEAVGFLLTYSSSTNCRPLSSVARTSNILIFPTIQGNW